ncbi:glycerol-3-phosphate acyltransferase [Bianquea renquensis]|jgi:glycerol-3-phosphate O-acyltransferase|uniref:Glycerol-3-phosphate acyltransferase n=1 Tax=Bianquea renquensis TaxID=2763661 RepID=A0A926DRQ9_9FIRM|nr:glycerol-3-phosphate acyltransferase [Bianquea renquensis]MBC8542099.1 glycerol-3-phosphate acyltransferase [Bianquea renquensis]
MEMLLYIASAVCAYLIAGINPAIEFSKRVYHRDIRSCGSGNPGFTNFKRTFGNKWAWWVLLLDLSKAAIVTAVFAWLFGLYLDSYQFGAAYTGFFALLGHAYPVWYKFKGGKGFLVYMSVIWFIDWRAGLVALGIMLVLLAITRYMSLSTVTAMLSCPITLAVRNAPASVILLCTVSVLYIAFRHKENFKRLIKGAESKFSMTTSKSADSREQAV